MIKLEKSQYLNSTFELNYIRDMKKRYGTELFITKISTNLERNILI